MPAKIVFLRGTDLHCREYIYDPVSHHLSRSLFSVQILYQSLRIDSILNEPEMLETGHRTGCRIWTGCWTGHWPSIRHQTPESGHGCWIPTVTLQCMSVTTGGDSLKSHYILYVISTLSPEITSADKYKSHLGFRWAHIVNCKYLGCTCTFT